MRKPFWLFCFLMGFLAGHAQGELLQEWEVQGQKYALRKVSQPNDACCKDIILLKVYREELPTSRLLLSFPLYRSYQDGHYEEVELGKFQIEGNQLLLFTWWNFRGEDNFAPVGAKKMVYEVRENGKLYLKSGRIYLEEGDRAEGAGFLKNPIDDESDRDKLLAYIRKVQREHLAEFVFGAESDALFEEVRTELEDEIQTVKEGWRGMH